MAQYTYSPQGDKFVCRFTEMVFDKAYSSTSVMKEADVWHQIHELEDECGYTHYYQNGNIICHPDPQAIMSDVNGKIKDYTITGTLGWCNNTKNHLYHEYSYRARLISQTHLDGDRWSYHIRVSL